MVAYSFFRILVLTSLLISSPYSRLIGHLFILNMTVKSELMFAVQLLA